MSDEWYLSETGYYFDGYTSFQTKDAAIRAAINEYARLMSGKKSYPYYSYELWYPGEELPPLDEATFFVGKRKDFEPHIDPFALIDRLIDDAIEFAGEEGEDYLNYATNEEIEELGKRLDEAFKAWAKDIQNEPSFFALDALECVEEIKVSDYLKSEVAL